MTLGFGGFEDPAVIPSICMYVVWLQEWQKEKEIPKKGKTFLKHTVSQQHVYYIDRSGFALKS